MNLYLIYIDFDDDNLNRKHVDYDAYDSAVVCAESEDRARQIVPKPTPASIINYQGSMDANDDWTDPDFKYSEYVKVELIGKASDKFVEEKCICSSYNAA